MHSRRLHKIFISAILLFFIANTICAESSRDHSPARLLAKQTGATQFEEERYETHTDCNNHNHHHLKKRASDEDVDYEVYQGVVGRPGIDFPIYPRIPKTSFSCRTIGNGYFADMETDCQVFHICEDGRKISFLCPNGTIFQQSELTCDWWFKVNCLGSKGYYAESAEILSKQRVQRIKPSIPVQGFNIVGGAPSIGLGLGSKFTSNTPRSRHLIKSERRMDSTEEQPSLESVDFEDISGEKQLKGQQRKFISNIENNSNDNESQITAETASFVGNKHRNNYNYEKSDTDFQQKSINESRKQGKSSSRRVSNGRSSHRYVNSKQQNNYRNEPYSQKGRNGARGQQRFQNERKQIAESYESDEQLRLQALPEKIIQTLAAPTADISPKYNNRVDIISKADLTPSVEEFQVVDSSSKTQETKATTSSYSIRTYSTARRLDSTRTTPFYTPTVPSVVKSKTTEGKSFYVKGNHVSTTPNSYRLNAGIASSLVLESSGAMHKSQQSQSSTKVGTSTTTGIDQNPNLSSTLQTPFKISMHNSQKESSAEIHRIHVTANSHFNMSPHPNRIGLNRDSAESTPTTTSATSTGPTYLPKNTELPSTNDDDAGGDSLLFAPSVVNDDSVTRNVNEMLKTINLLKETMSGKKLYDVEEIKFQGKIREGLEIPPSSGPDALISLAKYFASEQNDSTANSLNAVDNGEKSGKSGIKASILSNRSNDMNESSDSNGLKGSSGVIVLSGLRVDNRSKEGSVSRGSGGIGAENGVRRIGGITNRFGGSSGIHGTSGGNGVNVASVTLSASGSRGSNGVNGSNESNKLSGTQVSYDTYSSEALSGSIAVKGANGASGSIGKHESNASTITFVANRSSGLNEASGASEINEFAGSLNGSSGSSKRTGSSVASSATKPSKGTVSTASITTPASASFVEVKPVGIKGSLLSENTVNQYSNLFGLKQVKGKQHSTFSSKEPQNNEKSITTTTTTKTPHTETYGSFPQIASTDATLRNLAEKPESRKISQVFSNALTTYLEDPESFREQLASARPTEPPARSLSKLSNIPTTQPTPNNFVTSAVYLPTRQSPEVTTTTPAPMSLAVEINNRFEHSTPALEFTLSTTELYDSTTLKPFGDSAEKNHLLELSAELYPPSPDSGEGEEFFQREQTQSFVNSRNHLQNINNQDAKKSKDNATSILGYTTTPPSTENLWSHISANDFLDPLTINDGLMKDQRTTTASPFTYLPKETTTELITTSNVDVGRQELLSDYAQRVHHSSGVKSSGNRNSEIQHTLESDSWHDIFSNYDLPRETLPSSSGLQRIANKLFGSLNEVEALHLKNVMQQAEHNRQVLSLLLLLIQTCDDQNGKALERSRKHLLNALIDMDGKIPDGKTSHHKTESKKNIHPKVITTTSRVPITTYRRRSDDFISTPPMPYVSTTTELPFTTVLPSTLSPGSAEETTKFEIRVEDFEVEDLVGPYTTPTTIEGSHSSSSDKRALELLKSLYFLASKFTSRR